MPLFQTAVVHKYLKQQDSARMATAYAAFKAHFHDAAVQANIREAKEEQCQGGFLRNQTGGACTDLSGQYYFD